MMGSDKPRSRFIIMVRTPEARVDVRKAGPPRVDIWAIRNQSSGVFAKEKASGDVFGPQHRGFWYWLRGRSCGQPCCTGWE